MKATVLKPDQLTSAHLEAWSRWQCADETVDSPFFRPEYTQAVAAVRSDVLVAVLEEKGAVAGFFPFQRGFWGAGKPIGGRMTDFQGVIARPGLEWNAAELVRGCGLRAWDFDHLPASQQLFRSHHYATAESPYLDLGQGFDAYQAERSRSGSRVMQETLRKGRKMAREVGPLRFEEHATDPTVLQALMRWKSEQYVRTKVTNVFAFPWTRRLVEQVLGQSGELFAGVLSALYAGPHLVAVHLGLRSRGVLHWWFPTYNPSFSSYSPGLVLLVELSRTAAARGIRRIDLGKGESQLKRSFGSGVIPLAEGSVAVHGLTRLVRRSWHHTRRWLRSSSLRGITRWAGRWTRPVRGWLAFR